MGSALVTILSYLRAEALLFSSFVISVLMISLSLEALYPLRPDAVRKKVKSNANSNKRVSGENNVGFKLSKLFFLDRPSSREELKAVIMTE